MLFDNLCLNSMNLIAAGASKPPLQFRIDTLIFSLVIFAILIFVLLKYAWKPIMEGLDKREKSISGDIEGARVANEQAQAKLTAYEEKLAAAHDEAAAVIAESKKDAILAKEKIMADAAADGHKLIVLTASNRGYGLYRQFGFEHIFDYHIYTPMVTG